MGGGEPPLPPYHLWAAPPGGEHPGGPPEQLHHLAVPGPVLLQAWLFKQHPRYRQKHQFYHICITTAAIHASHTNIVKIESL